jgi:DtxR family transcriptional regulator, manganese transport regulator
LRQNVVNATVYYKLALGIVNARVRSGFNSTASPLQGETNAENLGIDCAVRAENITFATALKSTVARRMVGFSSPNPNNSLREGAMSQRALAKRGGLPLELPAEVTQARRFGKARSAKSTALLEDYVELIADLLATAGEARPTDIARRLGVSHPTAINTIMRLKREALATARPYRGVFLTAKGEALARRVRARHRLVVDILLALGVPAEAAEADAEGIEHYVSEITLKAFARFLQSQKKEM